MRIYNIIDGKFVGDSEYKDFEALRKLLVNAPLGTVIVH